MTDQPKLKTLADLPAILRDKSTWPEDFEWDFANPNRCAMGLAIALGAFRELWPEIKVSEGIFSSWDYWPVRGKLVTPFMVADRIDEYLKAPKP